ncbi:histidine kinase dimerization/phosphoacceptor domain-containing protein, partial [Streptosporangium algeriense]
MRNPSGVLRAWLNDRPLVPDTALAVTLAGVAVLLLRAAPPREGTPEGLAVALAVAWCLSLVLRRRAPFSLLLMVCLAGVALGTLGVDGLPLWPAMLLLVYTVAAHRGLALSLCGLVWSLVCHFAATVPAGTFGDWGVHLPVTVLTVTMWITGRSVRLRRAYMEELRDRARRTERAREADTRAARAEERSRIARELHDVVAHHVSVMTVQASAARRVLATNPEGAREALSAIEELGRTAMAEMRSIVGVLRTDASPAERNPQPGVAEIPALVDQMR